MEGNDAYAVLGITADATELHVRKAYRQATLLVHPDRRNDTRAKVAFVNVQAAQERSLMSKPERSSTCDSKRSRAERKRRHRRNNTAVSFLSDAAFALAIRAALARTYASPRELLRDSHGHGGEHLRHLLNLHGPRDETCPHCDRAAIDTQVHQRFHCPTLQLYSDEPSART